MKQRLLLSVGVVALIVAALLITRRTSGGSRHPVVSAAIDEIRSTVRNGDRGASDPKQPTVTGDSTRPIDSGQTVHRASDQVFGDAIAISSFFLASELSGLSDEQVARLELLLTKAKRTTYDILIARGTTTFLPNGGVRIEIPAQGDDMAAMRNFIRDSIEEIVGKDQMRSIDPLLGRKFEAKFGYFGRYETTIDLSVDEGRQRDLSSKTYVTMRSEYKRVSLLSSDSTSGRMVATHVLKGSDFEREYMPLERLKPKS